MQYKTVYTYEWVMVCYAVGVEQESLLRVAPRAEDQEGLCRNLPPYHHHNDKIRRYTSIVLVIKLNNIQIFVSHELLCRFVSWEAQKFWQKFFSRILLDERVYHTFLIGRLSGRAPF